MFDEIFEICVKYGKDIVKKHPFNKEEDEIEIYIHDFDTDAIRIYEEVVKKFDLKDEEIELWDWDYSYYRNLVCYYIKDEVVLTFYFDTKELARDFFEELLEIGKEDEEDRDFVNDNEGIWEDAQNSHCGVGNFPW